MSKATTKTALAAMIAGNDGVTVIQENGAFQVMFGFSNNLVNKMKTVPGAEFNKDEGAWGVPASSTDNLIEAVADMRDFLRSNGVQVKNLDGGGKQVLFDYNKQMTQIIGAVNGAEFDDKTRTWNVPAGSKALVVPAGQTTSYLDMAINRMRGLGIEEAQDRESIKEMAAASAQAMGAKPGIHYPKASQSYSGPMVNVNGNYAAQLVDTKDSPEGKIAFMVIHNLSDIGDVFKGQDLRIDYDASRHADVRSADLFKKQQVERESLTAKAASLVDGANVLNASIKDGSKYSGTVLETTANMILMSGGRKDFTIHRRDILGGADIHENQKVEVAYKGGRGHVMDVEKQKAAQGVGR